MARKDENLRGALSGVLANKQAEEKRNTQQAETKTAKSWGHLTVRVDRATRVHWLIEAKREGKDLTKVVIELLTQRYGIPRDQEE